MTANARLSKIFLLCACVLMCHSSLTAPSVEAQAPLFTDPYAQNKFTIEVLLPQLDESLVSSYCSRGFVASARINAGSRVRYLFEIPVFFVSSDGVAYAFSGGLPLTDEGGSSQELGNIMIGAEFGVPRDLLFSLGLRLPTFSPTSDYVILGGAVIDPLRIGHVIEDAIAYRAHVNWYSDSTSTTSLILRSGLRGWLTTDSEKTPSQLFMDLEPALRFGNDRLGVVVGTSISTPISSPFFDAFGEWQALFNFGMNYRFTKLTPGIQLRLPAGQNLRPLDLIIGFSIAYAP